MKQKQILIIARQEGMNRNLADWTRDNKAYQLSFTDSDERAIELFQKQSFDLVIADAGHAASFKKLNALMPILNEEAELICHEGETGIELDQKIKLVFERKKAERMKRLLVLDSTIDTKDDLFSFSAN